jgi:FkbM family methyltransferase
LKLDFELLFVVPNLPIRGRFGFIIKKYLFFLRDRLVKRDNFCEARVFGWTYRYNDRFGLGSLQRVYCSSWKLNAILPKRPVVVDVGANLGQFNLFCRHYLNADRVISIEPVPSCYQLLLENVERPSDCINALVTVDERETLFYISQDSQLSSTIRNEKVSYCEEVPLTGIALHRLLEGKDIDWIDLLKIDTEGSELEVLRSAEQLLKKTRVVLVEMSIFRENSGDMFAVGSFLEARGFRLHELSIANGDHPADADGIFVRQ